MEAGPSRMYMQQMAAFSARSSMITDLGPSTEDSPPAFTPPDIEGLKALKKSVVENLPTHCSHCRAELLPEYFVERDGGTVIAYCKKRGACGKSLVLFAGVDMVRPIYRKICPFKMRETTVEQLSIPTVSDNNANETSSDLTEQMQSQQHHPTRSLEMDLHGMLSSQAPMDIYALHGINRPTDMCILCNKEYSRHEHVECDRHGWVHDHDELLALPDDWPEFDSRHHRWVERRHLRSIFSIFR